MDVYLRPGHSELEGTHPKHVGASMPVHLHSSTHGEMELQSGQDEVSVTHGATFQKPALKQRAMQEPSLQDAGGERARTLSCASMWKPCTMRMCRNLAMLCIQNLYPMTMREGCN